MNQRLADNKKVAQEFSKCVFGEFWFSGLFSLGFVLLGIEPRALHPLDK